MFLVERIEEQLKGRRARGWGWGDRSTCGQEMPSLTDSFAARLCMRIPDVDNV